MSLPRFFFVLYSFFSLAFARNIGSPAQIFLAPSSCPNSEPSCQNTTVQPDLCCFESPGGLLLQTQFWDTRGPAADLTTSWTVHGLWPDNCDGTFQEHCDGSRNYKGISSMIENAGETELLDFMNKYWVDINGENERFWEHEWSTHGTCYSTLRPECLSENSQRGSEVVYFVATVKRLFESLPTYDWLAQAGITPSHSSTFALSELTDALHAQTGVTPQLDCHGKNLNQISWYFNLKGSVIDGTFIPIDTPKEGSCPRRGIRYPPKSGYGEGNRRAPVEL